MTKEQTDETVVNALHKQKLINHAIWLSIMLRDFLTVHEITE